MEIKVFKLKMSEEMGMTNLIPASLSEFLTTDFIAGEKGRNFISDISTKTYFAEITGKTQSVLVPGLKSRDETLKDRPVETFVIVLDPSYSDCMTCDAYKDTIKTGKTMSGINTDPIL